MTVVGNVVWLVLAGLWLGIAYLVAGVLTCLTLVGIPLGVQSFKLAGYVVWPFGRTIVELPEGTPALSCLGNVAWLVLGGWWLALLHVALGLALFVTLVGIPLGIASFRMAVLALVPFGKRVVSQDEVPVGARVVIGPVRRWSR